MRAEENALKEKVLFFFKILFMGYVVLSKIPNFDTF